MSDNNQPAPAATEVFCNFCHGSAAQKWFTMGSHSPEGKLVAAICGDCIAVAFNSMVDNVSGRAKARAAETAAKQQSAAIIHKPPLGFNPKIMK